MAGLPQTLDATLDRLSADIWERLGTVKYLPASRSVRFGEETITDILMLDLNRQGFRRARFTQTPKHRESKKGTDFECWLGSDAMGWIRLAMQAKKLDLRSNRYNTLNHKVKAVREKELRQIDVLKSYADANDAVPLYCLYNYSDDVDPYRHWHCCQRSFRIEEMGCTLTPLSRIKKSIVCRGKRNFDFIHEYQGTLPWRCLASCPNILDALEPSDEDKAPELHRESSLLFETRPRRYTELPPVVRGRVSQSEAPNESVILQTDEFDSEYYSPEVGLPKRICVLERDE